MAEEADTTAVAQQTQGADSSEEYAEAQKQPGTLVSEDPVPSKPVSKTSAYVVTVDNQTGLPTKIERLDEQTGERSELSGDELTSALAYWGVPAAAPAASLDQGVPKTTAEINALTQAYYKGVADYLNALTSRR